VPVTTSHSESLNVETEKSFEIEEIKTLLVHLPELNLRMIRKIMFIRLL